MWEWKLRLYSVPVKTKNQLIDIQERLEQNCNVLPVFEFHNAKNDVNVINLYLLPILVNERDIEPIVIKKADKCI